jgi:hypothetical protein
MMKLHSQHPDLCLAANGLHPCSVKPDTLEQELRFCEDKMNTHPFVAIGECMLEVQANGFGPSVLSYGGDTFNTAVYLRRCAAPANI